MFLNITGPISEIIFHEKVNKLCHENWLYLAFFIQSTLCRLWTELRHPLSENGTLIQLGAGKWLDRLKYLLSDLMFDGQKIAVFNSTILPTLPDIFRFGLPSSSSSSSTSQAKQTVRDLSEEEKYKKQKFDRSTPHQTHYSPLCLRFTANQTLHVKGFAPCYSNCTFAHRNIKHADIA